LSVGQETTAYSGKSHPTYESQWGSSNGVLCLLREILFYPLFLD